MLYSVQASLISVCSPYRPAMVMATVSVTLVRVRGARRTHATNFFRIFMIMLYYVLMAHRRVVVRLLAVR